MIHSPSRLVLDSTVIIALGILQRYDLLRWQVLIPEGVLVELKSELAQTTLATLKKEEKAEIMRPNAEMRKKALAILGDQEETGDSDLIATVLELEDVVIATDDRRLRTICKVLGAQVTGTLGIIVDAVQRGFLSGEEGKELLKKLDASGFRMTVALYEKALALMKKAKS